MLKKVFLLLVQLFAFVELHSQLCKGSLGDPIVNITFGAGTNPGGPLTSTKNLQYYNYDCPDDGSYTIRNNTSQCFDNTWHIVNSDHTGDANGYFMLINAAIQKSEFYVDTIRSLCPNTTYEFAAWIMNVLVPSACGGFGINPNLTFRIERVDGSILQEYSTGDILVSSTPVWKQHGFFFATPLNTSDIVLRIINNSTGGCGNDLAIDDITFRACGPQLTSYFIGEQGTTKELCEGSDADVQLACHIAAGYNHPSYQWQQSNDSGITYKNISGATDTTLRINITSNTPAGNYLYRLSVAEGSNINLSDCSVASGSLAIHINSKPVTNAQSNSPVCEGTAAVLSATGGSEYIWTGANGYAGSGANISIDNAQLGNSGTYYVVVKTVAGCENKDLTILKIIPAPDALINFSSKTICEGDSVFLSCSGGTSYTWSPSSGLSSAVIANPVATPADTTIYTVIVQNETACKDSATVTIDVIAAPEASAGPDQNILEGQSFQLAGAAYGNNISYSWSPDMFINNVNVIHPVVNPVNDITYLLKVTSNDGCGVSEDSVRIHVFKKVIIPNAFSPNGDGINDTWNIKALSAYNNYEISVYNRYGNLVFTTKDYSKQWDGSYNGIALPIGTYYYIINLKQGLPILKGYVVILR